MMRKIIAILFLSLLSITATEADELLKLPLLAKHYHQHSQADSHVSLLDFLVEHYSGNHGNDADSKEDAQLPFKTVNEAVYSSIFLEPLLPEQKTGPAAFSLTFPLLNVELDLDEFNVDIFHPPAKV